MSAPLYERAQEIKTVLETSIAEDEDLNEVLVTLDPGHASKAAPTGIVIVSPPRITFETFAQTELDWAVTIIAGPAQSMNAAWQLADAILERCRQTALPFDVAEPGSYTPPSQALVYPAYVLTFTETVTYQEETP